MFSLKFAIIKLRGSVHPPENQLQVFVPAARFVLGFVLRGFVRHLDKICLFNMI